MSRVPLSRRLTADTIAMCQHPDGPNEHVALATGEKIRGCFGECDCTPAIYVALDAVVEALRRGQHVEFGTHRYRFDRAARMIEREFGGQDDA